MGFDIPYYRGLMEKAWKEIAYAFVWGKNPAKQGWEAQKELSATGCSGNTETAFTD
jgi:hypothetical protein